MVQSKNPERPDSPGTPKPQKGREGRGRKRRGLEEVFHHFISEDEQAEVRASRAPEPTTHQEPPTEAVAEPAATVANNQASAWVLVAEPARPLHCWLAADLVMALPGSKHPMAIAASFEAEAPFRPPSWQSFSGDTLRASRANPQTEQQLYVLRAGEVGTLCPTVPAALLLPVDPSELGIQDALRALAALAPHGRRVCCLVTGTPESSVEDLRTRLQQASRREHGVEIERLAVLPRGRDDDRALLEGVSILARDPAAPIACVLQDLGWSLSDTQAARHG